MPNCPSVLIFLEQYIGGTVTHMDMQHALCVALSFDTIYRRYCMLVQTVTHMPNPMFQLDQSTSILPLSTLD
jgi:hypothetical protein